MAYLTHIQTLFAGALPNLGQTARLEIDPVSGDLLIHDPASQTLARAGLDSGPIAPGDFSLQGRYAPASKTGFDFQERASTLDRATLERLAAAPGEGTAYLDGVSFYGNRLALASAEIDGAGYLYMSRKSGQGIEVYALGDDGALRALQSLDEGGHLDAVTAMTTLSSGGRDWLVAASGSESGVSLYGIDGGGHLGQGTSFGFDDRLPVTTPTAMSAVELDGRDYVLMTAHGTSSLTVLEVTDGTLVFRDQVNDSLDTRFASAGVLDIFLRGDLALVALAGSDDGITLMQMVPGGRLIHRETLADDTLTALDNVTGLRFVEHGDGAVDLFALGVNEGLSRFRLDAGALGVTATGQDGSGGNDILTAGAAGGSLRGAGGDDILLDGAGRDSLWGGEGADIFVFHADGEEDAIRDFDPGEDRLDLGGFEMVHDISALGFTQTSGGAVVRIGADTLVISTQDGRSLTKSELAGALSLSADHVLMPRLLPQRGSDGNDTFEAGVQADTVDGGAGFDTIRYALSHSAVRVDLGDDDNNSGAAEGFVLVNLEGIVGTAFDDHLAGDDAGNILSGMLGDDAIHGRGGSDWITPGGGSDTVDGGAGRDMVSFVDLADTAGRSNLDYRLDIDLSAGSAVSHDGGERILLSDVERVTGTIYADRIKGDAGDNELRGLGDYDWFVATGGADSYDGGTGRDVISYVEAGSGVTVDLDAGRGLAGLAAGDSYANIERATGSSFADIFYGDAGENDFRGLGGYDIFVGSSGGRERYDGGTGQDVVAYFLSDAGVAASLLRGSGSGGDAARDLYTSIENLGGSSFDDVLTGDHGRNQLRGLAGDDFIFGNGGIDYITGGRGDDVIDGGDGSDYAVFAGARSEYGIARNGDSVTVTGPDGTDLLSDVEYFRFDDADVTIWEL